LSHTSKGQSNPKEIVFDYANLRDNEDEIMNNNEDVTFEERFSNKKNQISSEMKEVIESNMSKIRTKIKSRIRMRYREEIKD